MNINLKIKKILILNLFFCGILFFLFNLNFDNNVKGINNVSAGKVGAATTELDKVGKEEIKDVNGKAGLSLTAMMKGVFFGIIQFFAWMIIFAVALINFSLSEAYFSLLGADAIVQGWVIVRDFLNIAFIFFLLFSAFATIFQVSRYHIKSTWVMIVVMALLVNFSWPITRVIIDVSNVAMMYIINGDSSNSTTDVTSTGLLNKIGEGSGFAATIVGAGISEKDISDYDAETKTLNVHLSAVSWTRIFTGLVFSFLFMITVFAIAAILIIRVIVLAILLIFASIGFVGYAFPTTKSFASSWWSNLMKYAFIGPLMLFMLFLSATLFEQVSDPNKPFAKGVEKAAAATTSVGTAEMQSATQSIIPIIILWAGILAAQKLGDGASSAVIGGAKRGVAWGKNQTWGRTVTPMANYARKIPGAATKRVIKNFDHGMANFTNELANSDDPALQKTAKFMQNVRHAGSKHADKQKEKQESYESAVAESKARASGNEAELENLRTKNVNKIAEEQKNKSTKGLVDDLAEAKGDKLIASIQTLSKREDMSADQMKEFIKSLKKVKSEYGDDSAHAKTAESKIIKKANDTGNSHMLTEIGKTPEEIVDGMDVKTAAKQKVFKAFSEAKRSDANYKELGDMSAALEKRMDSFGDKGKQDLLNNMKSSDKRARAVSKARQKLYGTN